jgi:hypothetical protein
MKRLRISTTIASKLLRCGCVGLCALVVAGHASSASAWWRADGSGSGSGLAATMPVANQPSASVSGQSVTVGWSQSSFQGSPLGSYAGGGYTLTRYADGGGSGATPNATCATPISGATATLQCVEADVPYGNWQYTLTPVLGTFTGAEGPRSATVSVVPAAPALTALTAQNPASGEATGAIELSWSAVPGATGYNIYRRAGSGSYDFTSPLNGGMPYTAGTNYTDPGAGLTGGTTYRYVVRTVAGSPAVESTSSDELSATAIARPAAPGGSVAATAAAGGNVDVSWSTVSGVAGYNVYRRTSAGSYDFSAPLNGATPFSGTTYLDASATDGTSYFYTVRSVIIGAESAQVESGESAESNSATSDSSPPPAPSAVTVGSGGNVLSAASCGRAAGTRFINNAGETAVSVTATIAAPEAGETVVFSATTPGSTAVTATVAAAGMSVSATLDLSSLLDGIVTLTAQTKDLAGNLSATTVPTNAIVKDVVPAALSGLTYTNNPLTTPDSIGGTSECGATITAVETAGPNVGKTFPTSGTFRVGASGTFSGFTVDAASLRAYGYDVTATDLAGNPSAPVSISGTAGL